MNALNTHHLPGKLKMFLEEKIWWMHFANL